ncbi:MAG: helix-turn-helix domain-containing protein [Syntrophobacterales bacterium]|nr:helix-turn-helix domain-containing protein [Syntrophobacterales bacterium]
MTVKEASEYLRMSTQTIYNKINMRGLEYHKVGGKVLIKLSTLEKMVERGTVRARGGNGN